MPNPNPSSFSSKTSKRKPAGTKRSLLTQAIAAQKKTTLKPAVTLPPKSKSQRPNTTRSRRNTAPDDSSVAKSPFVPFAAGTSTQSTSSSSYSSGFHVPPSLSPTQLKKYTNQHATSPTRAKFYRKLGIFANSQEPTASSSNPDLEGSSECKP